MCASLASRPLASSIELPPVEVVYPDHIEKGQAAQSVLMEPKFS